jgi:hypothetical protein
MLVILLCASFASPAEAGPLDFLSRAGRDLGRLAGRILNAPGNVATFATRWMGPVLGPVAADWLAGRFISHRSLAMLMQKSGEIKKLAEDLETIEKNRKNLQQIYTDEAELHRRKAQEIQSRIDAIKNDPRGGDVGLLMNLRLLQNDHNRMADSLTSRAGNISTDDVIKLVGRNVLGRVVGNVKGVVVHEMGEEILRFTDPSVVQMFLDGGMDPAAAVDQIVEGNAGRFLRVAGYGDENLGPLKDRLKDRIKDQLEKDRDFFRRNWRSEMERIIREVADVKDETKSIEGDWSGVMIVEDITSPEGSIQYNALQGLDKQIWEELVGKEHPFTLKISGAGTDGSSYNVLFNMNIEVNLTGTLKDGEFAFSGRHENISFSFKGTQVDDDDQRGTFSIMENDGTAVVGKWRAGR